MKNLLTAILPALALFALGGCAGTSALTSSEDDGVYYSSRDHTTAVAVAPPASASPDEAANPDYNGSPARSSARQGSGSTEYYDNTYTYMRGVPNYGVTTYVPYSPYTAISYNAFGGYGWGGGACGYSPYAYGGFSDPFYSPFYSPYYGYGSGISISFGFGRPYGFGGYGYGRPYGYGYGGGFYDPYYYNSPYYGGYYGRGGYYGNNYYGGGRGYNNGYYNNGGGYNNNGGNNNGRTTGHRSDRMSDGRYSTGGAGTPTTPPATTGGGRVRTDGLVAPAPGPLSVPDMSPNNGGRTRSDAVTAAPSNLPPTRAEESYNRPRRMERADQPQYRNMEDRATTGQDQATRDNTRGRWRNAEAQPQNNDQMQPPAAEQPVRQEGQRRRGGFFQDVFTQPANNGGQAADQQPTRQRYEQPRQRTYEQPQQRSYEQPQRQRTYEQPQQRSYEQRSSSQPSYSAPSNGGGDGGGGGGHSRSRGE